MRNIITYCFILCHIGSIGQIDVKPKSSLNIRLSCLLFPDFSPLLTIEAKVIHHLTIQLESNFYNTHGVNLKLYLKETMSRHYTFLGLALLNSKYLRADKKITYLPYIGYGYAFRFGKQSTWIFDNRIGLGKTINANRNYILPVIKSGIGKLF
jgi:hypothetical protein